MCGDMLSSAWESEQRSNNMINWHDRKNNWMIPEVRAEISRFQDQQIEQEFAQAVEEHRIEEVYWVGGEPLMYEQHWRYMQRIIELGDGPKVYARYNTNLSRTNYRGVNLFRDILSGIRDWQVCASLDGTGAVGEWIRTGLDYDQWVINFQEGLNYVNHPRQMRIDFTLTLPGLFEVVNIQQLADRLGVQVLAKVIFSFTPEIILSPLALPRAILERKITELAQQLPPGALQDVILQLKNRPTFEEQWPDRYKQELAGAKLRQLEIGRIRGDTYGLDDILKQDMEIYDWWQQLA